MIDVSIQPIGRSLLAMGLGAMKYNAVRQQNEMQLFSNQLNEINRLKSESDFMSDLTFDLTTSMIDKRFSSSKQYLQTRGASGDFQFKKSTSKSDRALVSLTEKNAIKTRVRYNNAVSTHNKKILDKKMKSSFKLVDLKKYI